MIFTSIVSACAEFGTSRDGPPAGVIDVSRIPNAIPKMEPRSKSGNPSSYVIMGKRYYVLASSRNYEKTGVASWYGKLFHGRRTANGEIFDMYAMTAAHTTLPLPTYVEVTNLRTQQKVIVRVNDRGPFHDNRLIDLSYVAAKKLGIVATGTGEVKIRVIGRQTPEARAKNVNFDESMGQAAIETQSVDSAYYLQVGAFRQRNNAERLVSKLLTFVSNPVRVQVGQSKLGVLHRVWIGPFNTREGVKILENQLAHDGFKETQILLKPWFK